MLKEQGHTVTMYFGVSNFHRAISIVIPRSRSAFSLSSTQARYFISNRPHQSQLIDFTILKGAFSKLSSFLLKLFNSTLVDTTALVDQVTSGGGFSGINVTDDCDDSIDGVIYDGGLNLPTTLT